MIMLLLTLLTWKTFAGSSATAVWTGAMRCCVNQTGQEGRAGLDLAGDPRRAPEHPDEARGEQQDPDADDFQHRVGSGQLVLEVIDQRPAVDGRVAASDAAGVVEVGQVRAGNP